MIGLPRYRIIANGLRKGIENGSMRPGDRVISIRRLAEREGVSIPTAVEALRVIESEGLVVARPRSGFFVSAAILDIPGQSQPPTVPQPVTMASLARTLFTTAGEAVIPLGAALPDPAWLPVAALQRSLNSAARRIGRTAQSYSAPPGRTDLRRQIAMRAAAFGGGFGPDDLVITSGETQAMRLALSAVSKSGDIIAVESPAYFGALLLLESLGLRALEIPTDPCSGINLELLEVAIKRHRPTAVIASPTVQNPLGASLNTDAKRQLVRLLAQTQTPLIEDDVYGDLGPGEVRPPPCKAFDEEGLVLYCSSVSKTLAPGWRIGWIAAGRYHEKVLAHRLQESIAGAPLLEAALADFLAGGDYHRHLKRLRARVDVGMRAISSRVKEAFPDGTRIFRPTAGFLLWVEVPPEVDALDLHRLALVDGISVSPGHLFSPQSTFTHHLRLNCANEPTPRLLRAVDRVGQICRGLMEHQHDAPEQAINARPGLVLTDESGQPALGRSYPVAKPSW